MDGLGARANQAAVISFYSSTIFENVGYTPTQALYASLGYGAVQVVFTIPTLFLIDTKGRRTLTLATFPLMCLFLLAAGLSLLKTTGTSGERLGPVVLYALRPPPPVTPQFDCCMRSHGTGN